MPPRIYAAQALRALLSEFPFSRPGQAKICEIKIWMPREIQIFNSKSAPPAAGGQKDSLP
jgi:hypothetical protein